jgi:hypothetical protein
MSRIIMLTQGYQTEVDNEDYGWLSKYRWCAQINQGALTKHVYAVRTVGGRKNKRMQYMSRLILGIDGEDWLTVKADHKNGNTLDNQRHNLRVVNNNQHAENQHSAHKDSTTGIRGVRKHRKKYQVYVKYTVYGTYDTVDEAAAVAREIRNRLMTHSEMDK